MLCVCVCVSCSACVLWCVLYVLHVLCEFVFPLAARLWPPKPGGPSLLTARLSLSPLVARQWPPRPGGSSLLPARLSLPLVSPNHRPRGPRSHSNKEPQLPAHPICIFVFVLLVFVPCLWSLSRPCSCVSGSASHTSTWSPTETASF